MEFVHIKLNISMSWKHSTLYLEHNQFETSMRISLVNNLLCIYLLALSECQGVFLSFPNSHSNIHNAKLYTVWSLPSMIN
jgi:hypothetical protein